MAEFCQCGSLKINGNCTNKKCPFSSSDAAVRIRRPAAGTSGRSVKNTVSKTSAPKRPNPRKALKVITYNLYDLKKNDDNNQ